MKWNVCLITLSIAWMLSLPLRAGTGIDAAADSKQVAETAKAQSILEQNYLTGDWGGTRTKLEDKGVTFGAQYIADSLSNVSGGLKNDTAYVGRIQLSLALDFEKLAGLKGGSFYVSAYDIQGNQFSANALGNLMPASNIEAYNTLRLFDLWYQQEWFDGKLSLRFGQIAADDEFFISDHASVFRNGTFGWPALMGTNLPSGGPGYPLATPGVRVMVTPVEQLSLSAAVFDGDPGDSPGTTNPQKRDSSGTRVDFNQGVLAIFEAAYKLNQEKDAKGLPGTYKIGGFFDTFHTSDLLNDDQGLSLGDVDSTGTARQHPDNWGIYFIADQTIWRPSPPEKPKTAVDPESRTAKPEETNCCPAGLAAFWRVGGTPDDRNTVSFYTDGGLNYTGLIPGREQDVFGFGVAYAQISNDLIQLTNDSNNANGTNTPAGSYEMVFEWTYQFVVAPWWTVQPDVQYIVHPGGGRVADPDDSAGATALKDAVVLGVRTSITF